MTTHLRLIVTVSVLASIAGLAAAPAFAAPGTELYFRTTASAFAPGSDLMLGVFVNADEPVNAFDVEIGYSPATLEFVSFSISDSIVDVWRESPEVHADGIIRIQGGLREPFSGRAGELLRLVFRVRPEADPAGGEMPGTLQWSFRRANVYAADGKGTAVPASVAPLVARVVPSLEPVRLEPSADAEPPVFSVVRIAENPVDDAHFAVWEARDEGSGIVSSRIRVKRWLVWGPWETAVNPVRLQRGTWAVELRVTDGQGNSADARAYLWPTLAWKALLALLLVGIACAAFIIGRRKRERGTSG